MPDIEKLSVLLVNPAPRKDLFGAGVSFLPLGLAYIAAVLEHKVKRLIVLDLNVEPMDDYGFEEFIETHNPDVVGFTAVTPTITNVFVLAGIIKYTKPDIITILGGPHATALPGESLLSDIDFVIRGEGEETIVDLCQNLSCPENVRGISYKKDERIIHNPDRSLIKDLDKLSFPAIHLFPNLSRYTGQPALGNRLPVASLITSRGCPFNCNFCFKAVFGRKFRVRSVENILIEWRQLIKKFKVREIAIGDDAFTTNIGRVILLCERLIKERLNIPWSCRGGIRVDTAEEELLFKMKQAGCYRVAFGVESGSQKILDTIGKKIKLDQIRQAFRNARKAGLQTTGFFMIGNPGEDERTITETIKFAKELNPDYAQFTIATPYPGTELYEQVKEHLLVRDWDEYASYEKKAYFEMGEVTEELILRMHRKAYMDFYLRPGYILGRLFKMDTYRYLPRWLKALRRFLS